MFGPSLDMIQGVMPHCTQVDLRKKMEKMYSKKIQVISMKNGMKRL